MQGLHRRVLPQELDNRIVRRLLPVQHDGDLHDQLQGVSLRTRLWQDEVDIVLLGHLINEAGEVLLLDQPRFLLFLFADL